MNINKAIFMKFLKKKGSEKKKQRNPLNITITLHYICRYTNIVIFLFRLNKCNFIKANACLCADKSMNK